mmetsp:Transcript_66631/g.216827  ORF Transcript_66631/g.216827 Transcript_66631/m.216827 type:complete len:364 (-) Transcript_66631:240-1331(-)
MTGFGDEACVARRLRRPNVAQLTKTAAAAAVVWGTATTAKPFWRGIVGWGATQSDSSSALLCWASTLKSSATKGLHLSLGSARSAALVSRRAVSWSRSARDGVRSAASKEEDDDADDEHIIEEPSSPASSSSFSPSPSRSAPSSSASTVPRRRQRPAIAGHFATPIYRRRLRPTSCMAEIEQLNLELLEEAQQWSHIDEDGHRWSEKNYLGGYTSYASFRHLHKMSQPFRELRRYVDRHVRHFASHLQFKDPTKLEMTDCWVNVMPRGTFHASHIHPASSISGTYYVKTPPGCSAIRFEDPRAAFMMAAPPREAELKRRNDEVIDYPARSGELILFESWLRHGVAPSSSDQERVSISFNYHWC